MDGRMDGRTDNVKTVYPPQTAVVGVDRPIKALSMHIQRPLRITKGNNSHRISPYFLAISICHVNMNMCARFEEILSMTLQVM